MSRILGKHDRSNIIKAIGDIRGGVSLREAAKVYGIPRSTLNDKLRGKTPIETTQGPSPILTTEEEDMLVEWAKTMNAIGYGRTKNDVLDKVQEIIQSSEPHRKNPFKGGRPGKDWWKGFLRRHPRLSLRSPRQLEKTATAWTHKNWTAGLRISCPTSVRHCLQRTRIACWLTQDVGTTPTKLGFQLILGWGKCWLQREHLHSLLVRPTRHRSPS